MAIITCNDSDSGDHDAGDQCPTEIKRAVFNVWHPSFIPFDAKPCAVNATPAGDPRALAAINRARDILASHKKTVVNANARKWAALPRWARRLVLSGSGIDPLFWERPIDSFSATERARIGAAAREVVRVCGEINNVA